MIFPEKFVAGETIEKTLSYALYPADDWVMTVIALSVAGNIALEEVASADGNSHFFNIDTSSLSSGTYSYQAKVEKGSEVHYVESGSFVVSANLFSQIGSTGNITSLDTRTHAEKMLVAIEALLEGRALREHKTIKQNGRELTKHSFSELIELRDYYRGEIARANVKKRGKFKNIGIRF